MEQFIVSARKYRPATFASVVGQHHITSTLKNAIERGQLAHAYLFCGPRGVGKTTCARIFAKSINCPNIHDGEACNECESCKSVAAGTSMYIHELDAASNNSVQDIRNLIDEVRVIPQGAQYSVFIIDEVHMLSQQAFNAFLKTLEEPPKHAIFILATTEKHKIIPTILSRCQIFDFNRIKVEDVVAYLKEIADKEGVTYDEESLNLIAQKADGGMRDALSTFDKSVSFCDGKLNYKNVADSLNILDYDTYFHLTEILSNGDYITSLLEFDSILSKGFSAQTFLQGLDKHMRDLLVSKGGATTLVDYTEALITRYNGQAAKLSTGFLFGAIDLLTTAEEKIRYSSNSRLLTELTIMKISQLGLRTISLDNASQPQNYALPNIQAQPVPKAQDKKEDVKIESQTNTSTAPAAVEAAVDIQTPSQPVNKTSIVSSSQSAEVKESSPSEIISELNVSKIGTERIGSLSQLLKQVSETSKATGNSIEATTDPLSQKKISESRDRIIEAISASHPRMLHAFENMTIDASTLHLSVPSQALKDEILRERDDIVHLVADIAGVNGMVRIEIDVNETEVKMKPTKLEDKLQHIKKNSPELETLIKSLELELI